MGQGGKQVLHWETKEKVMALIRAVDRKHVIKHPDKVAEEAVLKNGKTVNDLCDAVMSIADGIMYRQWRVAFLGSPDTKAVRDFNELMTETYYFYNTVICNSEK